MNPRKRLSSHRNDSNDSKRRKQYSTKCLGNAIQMEIQLNIHSLDIPMEIVKVIHSFSEGLWESCIRCQNLTDPDHSKRLFSLHGGIKYRCTVCDDEIMENWRKRKKNEFPFDD